MVQDQFLWCIWISNCSSTIWWKYYYFSSEVRLSFIKDWLSIYIGFILDSFSVSLAYMSLFMQRLHYLNYYSLQ